MAEVRYTKVAKTVTVKGVKKTVYCPAIVRSSSLSTKELGTKMARQSTLSEAESKAFVKAVAAAVVEELMAGYAVKLDGLGTFSPAIKSRAVKTRAELTVKTITKKTVNFLPAAEIKQHLAQTTFRQADNIDIAHIPGYIK